MTGLIGRRCRSVGDDSWIAVLVRLLLRALLSSIVCGSLTLMVLAGDSWTGGADNRLQTAAAGTLIGGLAGAVVGAILAPVLVLARQFGSAPLAILAPALSMIGMLALVGGVGTGPIGVAVLAVVAAMLGYWTAFGLRPPRPARHDLLP